jgi:hypothetical protein
MVTFVFTDYVSIQQFDRTADKLVDDPIAWGFAACRSYLYRLDASGIYPVQKRVVHLFKLLRYKVPNELGD